MKSYFWGIFLISSGLFLVLKYYLNLNIPTGRVLIGLFLISLGLSVLIGGFGFSDSNKLIFGIGKLESNSAEKDYNIVFGQGTLDLSDIPTGEMKKKIEINTVFATTELILPKDISVFINANAAFASTVFPDGSQLNFGDRVYQSKSDKKNDADLIIEMNTVFGRTEITQK